MAVYRFKISFKDKPEVSRIIDVIGLQHFEIFHKAILKSVKFKEGELAAFYLNYKTESQIEIPLSDVQSDEAAVLMKSTKIQDIFTDDVKEITYVYDFLNMWEFNVELIQKFDSSTPNVSYPNILESSGTAPLQSDKDIDDDFDEEDLGLIKNLLQSNAGAFDTDLDEEEGDDIDEYNDSDSSNDYF